MPPNKISFLPLSLFHTKDCVIRANLLASLTLTNIFVYNEAAAFLTDLERGE